MNSLKVIKIALIGACLAIVVFCATETSLPTTARAAVDKNANPATEGHSPEEYVGSETCQQCHEDQFNSFAKTAHGRLKEAGWKSEKQGCESCHGPGKAHVEGAGDKTKIRTFENETPKQMSDSCLQCHAGREEHNNFRRGEHWRNDVSCLDCHSPHVSSRLVRRETGLALDRPHVSSSPLPVGPFPAHGTDLPPDKLLVKPEPQLCITCHNETKAQFLKPFHHRVLEGVMKCTDCHNQHGGFELKQARRTAAVDQACMKCHSDKQGPFVFEHPAKLEGCSTCHDTHGSSNPRLLKRNAVAQLCIECHTESHQAAAPTPPSFHNLEQSRYQNCTTCHTKIHGSNAHPKFFR